MNLPLFLPGMQTIIVVFFAVFAGAAVTFYLLRYKFKHSVIRKCLTIFVLTIAGLALAYILFYTISNAIGRAKVESRLAEMRTQGIPLDKDAILPKMPEKNADNGAFFYKAAFGFMKVSSPYKTLLDIQENQPAFDIALWHGQARSTVEQILKTQDIELILKLFKQGADKPNAVYNRDYQGFETLLPELNSQRALFRLISLKSSSFGLNGKPEAGYSLICDGFKTIKQFESEPFVISQLVNIACASINIETMNSLIYSCGISSRTALLLMAGLDKLDFNAAMIHATDGEIMNGRDVFEKIISRKKTLNECFGGNSSLIEKYGLWPFIYNDYIWYLTYMAKVRALFLKSYWLDEKQIDALNNELSRNNLLSHYCLISAAIAMSPNLRIKTARIESEIDAAKLTLALHIYKNQNGTFPDSLEQLAPGILKAIPVDPVSGKPF
ncbi:MAG: hypothetical protein WCV67_11210, partial [Victivallaceae bacterium]